MISADGLEWLLDIDLPLVIEGRGWRSRAAAVKALPRWFYEPTPNVKAFFAFVRGEGPLPNVAVDVLWAEVIDHISHDFIAFIWHFVFVQNRDTRRLELFCPSAAQLILVWRVMALVDAGKPVRISLLKQRQGGFSFVVEVLGGWFASFHKNINGVVAAQDTITSGKLFRYLKDVHEQLPDEVRPAKEYSSRKELVLREPDEDERRRGNIGQNSSLVVQTAGNDFVGSGQPLQFLHASEIGKWDKVANTQVVWDSVANAIQDEPLTFVIMESTAHGANTFFHAQWKLALKMGSPGWSGYTPIFLPWYLDDRNRRPCPPRGSADWRGEWGTHDDDEFGDETSLREQYDLDDEQLEWRRRTIVKQAAGRDKVETFKQEHPSNEAEAWLHADGKWLEPKLVAMLTTRLEKDERAGGLRVVFQGDLFHRRRTGTTTKWLDPGKTENDFFRRRPGGNLIIYRLPNHRLDYVIGADVAEGIPDDKHVHDEGGGHDEHDDSCAQVFQRAGNDDEIDGRSPMRLVAEWYGRIEDHEFAHMLWRLGWFYCTKLGELTLPAMLAWEKTGPGRGIAKWLRLGEDGSGADAYPHLRMYQQQESADPSFKRDHQYGISSNRATKPVMLADWRASAQNNLLQLNRATLLEAAHATRNDRGHVDTQGLDHLMASVIANYASSFRPHVLEGYDNKVKDEPQPGTVAWALKQAAERKKKGAGPTATFERLVDKP